jgi:hypothetical protein
MTRIAYKHPVLKENNEPITLTLYSRKIVCPCCDGEGHHFRSDLDENDLVRGIRQEHDYESWELYKSGAFNQTCSHCKGRNVVDELDWDYFEEMYPEYAKKVHEYNRAIWEDESNRAWERSMGA